MALLRLKRNHEQVPTQATDYEEDDETLVPEVQFYVNYLGSMLVPTSNGHGSARTSTSVGKIYTEKYKIFSFNTKKYRLQINNDCLILFDCTGKDSRQVDTFYMKDITFCSTDRKHEKAFVFVYQEKKDYPYRAFVFHCENSAKAEEIFQRVSATSRVHRNLMEVARMKSLCTDGSDIGKITRTTSLVSNEEDKVNRDSTDEYFDQQFRRRCQSEIPKRQNHHKILNDTLFNHDNSDVWIDSTVDLNPVSEIPSNNHGFDEDEDDDEFTALASNRTKSLQYTGLPHHLSKNIDKPHETHSLMNNKPVENDTPILVTTLNNLNNLNPFNRQQQSKSTPAESENLLQF